MTANELAQFMDHTLLVPDATEKDVERLVDEAKTWNTFAVCVNSGCVPIAAKYRGSHRSLRIAATVGFPLGQVLTEAKVAETIAAIRYGADEIDMVYNLGAFLSGNLQLVSDDIEAVVKAAHPVPVKVILETARLSAEQIYEAAQLAVRSGAHTVKTSTGFGFSGATVDAVKIMRDAVGPNVGVKASGGIGTYQDALHMIEAGATRLGLSKTVSVLSMAPGAQ